MTKSELIEKCRKEIKQHIVDTYGCEETPQYEEEFDDLESILTRLLAEYDAQGGVEGWHRECGDTIANFVNDNSKAGKPTYSAEIAALIASHAPKGVDVDAVWRELGIINASRPIDWTANTFAVFTKAELTTAIKAAQGEK